MPAKPKTVRVTSPILPGRASAEDPAAELRAAFSQLDESPDEEAPDCAEIAAEIGAWRAQR